MNVKKIIVREGLYIVPPFIIMGLLCEYWLKNENGVLWEFGRFGIWAIYIVIYSIRFIIWAIRTLKTETRKEMKRDEEKSVDNLGM